PRPAPRGRAATPERSAPASGRSAGHASQASNSLRRPPKEKVPFSPLRRQYGGGAGGGQSGAGRLRPRNGRIVTGWRPPVPEAGLPEEGLEPTRTYAQALLRRPRLPFRHSGVRCPASISEYARWELIRDVSV